MRIWEAFRRWQLGGNDSGGELRPTPLRCEEFSELLETNPEASAAYDALLSSLELLSSNGLGRRLLVTSARPGEGKTTVAVNLALMATAAGRSVVLVDADLRRPSLHTIMGVQNTVGLANLLTEELATAEVLRKVELTGMKSPAGTLAVVPSGPFSLHSIHTLRSERLQTVFETLSQQYDLVLIDSPPILSVNDPLVLSSSVDDVLLVVSAGAVRSDELRIAKERLERAGARVCGSVLNRFDKRAYDLDYHPYSYSNGQEPGSHGRG